MDELDKSIQKFEEEKFFEKLNTISSDIVRAENLLANNNVNIDYELCIDNSNDSVYLTWDYEKKRIMYHDSIVNKKPFGETKINIRFMYGKKLSLFINNFREYLIDTIGESWK